jgi:hypothetical protein
MRHRLALRIGDRDHRDGREGREHRLMLRQVEASMQGRHERRGLPAKQRERVVVEMEMQEVEVGRLPADLLQHHHMQGTRVANGPIEPQRSGPYRPELGGRDGIAAGEQRDIVPERDQLLGQPGDYPFRSAIELGRNGLGQRGDLRDAHGSTLL